MKASTCATRFLKGLVYGMYAHLSLGHIQAAIEKGSLIHLGIKTGSALEAEESEPMKVVDLLVRPTGVEPVTS